MKDKKNTTFENQMKYCFIISVSPERKPSCSSYIGIGAYNVHMHADEQCSISKAHKSLLYVKTMRTRL